MRVLALDPYHGGSHRAFLTGWARHSQHDFTVLSLPPHKWKWRMRHAAVTFARQVADRVAQGGTWDALFCTDMLNLAEFIGLAPPVVQRLPRVAYFHENQLTYPFRDPQERDLHFGFTNMTTAAAAHAAWFNSAFNRDSFLNALQDLLRRMPDHPPLDVVDAIRDRSAVQPPGVEWVTPPAARPSGPIWIIWAARWEHDKRPQDLFAALRRLKQAGVPFQLSVVGEQFHEVPPAFVAAQSEFAAELRRWGFQPARADYEAALREADVFVSTAEHEFFGLSAAEAISAGCFPLLPRRLAYPELVGRAAHPEREPFFYDGTPEHLAARLTALATAHQAGDLWTPLTPDAGVVCVEGYAWSRRAPALDAALEQVSRG